MGNSMCMYGSSAAVTGKVILFDGSVQEFDKPFTVAELMLEHPQQVVVELQSALNRGRPTPLPADKSLEMKKVYLMLPMKRGKQPELTSEETRRFLSIVNSVLRSRSPFSSTKILPWFARICLAGTTGEGRKSNVIQKKEHTDCHKTIGERGVLTELVPEMLEGRPEYWSRQLSGRGWKPSLDPIEEKKFDGKLLNWLSLKKNCSFNLLKGLHFGNLKER